MSRSSIQNYYYGSTFNNSYPTLGGTTDYRVPLSSSEFTFITCLEGSRYKNNIYYSLGSSQQYPLTLLGTYLLVHTDYIINWGASENDFYNFYVLPDDNINSLYYICTDQNDPTIKYYYIPSQYSDIVQNIIEQDPFMTYEYYYTFPGSGTPLTSMTITSFFSPTLRAPVYETFSTPSYLAFASVSGVATTTELDNSYTHNELAYQREAVLSSSGTNGVSGYVERAFYYDYLGRIIQTVEKNHLGGISRTSFKYDLAGNILTKYESHQRGPESNSDPKISIFTYDNRGRMLTESASVIPLSSQATVTYTYNELGQLTGKTYGNGATESMSYNIQGWLSSKSAAKSGTNLFSMNLLYYNSTRATNKYNGNIVEWQWTQGTGSQNSYALTYDKLDRLTNSNRYVAGTATNAFTEKNLTYDKNGNITQLQRYGSTGTIQDNFTYSYNGAIHNGNRLSSISGSVSATYAYDNNGNMTTDGRKNLAITYNVLNLQQTLSQSGTAVANYSWLADGTKCAVADNSGNGYEYLGSLIYRRTGSTLTLESTDFGGGRLVYNGGVITISGLGTFYDADRYYYITDHLGSIRVITNNSGTVQERNDYYPFGGRHANGDYAQLAVNKQKFNGKELQTTGFLDYGARMYDDAIGRWSVVDPLAEKYYNFNPYEFCFDNPLKFIDFDGRDPGNIFKTVRIAAKDWGNYYNGASILRQKEFGSKIYQVKKDGKIIGYSYSEASEGNAHNVIPSNSPNGEKVIADIHSHGNDDVDYDDNHFSDTDKKDNNKKKINGYLASPNGSLQEYNSITKTTTVISTDLPSDPNDPDRKNKKNPTDIPKEKQRATKIAKQEKNTKQNTPEYKK